MQAAYGRVAMVLMMLMLLQLLMIIIIIIIIIGLGRRAYIYGDLV
jgi:hypothetical protein